MKPLKQFWQKFERHYGHLRRDVAAEALARLAL